MLNKFATIFITLLATITLAGLIFKLNPPPKEVKGITSETIGEITPTPELIETIPSGKYYAPIINYHHIAYSWPQQSYYVSENTFDDQMNWLRENGYHVVSFDKFYNAALGEDTLPEKPIAITFDDGNRDNYTNALPILKKYDYPATFFIKLNNVGKGGLTWDEIREIKDAGNIIGSHSINHNNMAKMDEQTLINELTISKNLIETNINTEVKYFAYPGGAYSQKTIEALKETGYLAAVTTKHKVYQDFTKEDSLYTIPRLHIDDEMPTFIDWVQGKNLI